MKDGRNLEFPKTAVHLSTTDRTCAKTTARVVLPQVALDAIDGERRGTRAVRRLVDGFAVGPDDLLHDFAEVVEADGEMLRLSPRKRAFMRAVAKRLEANRGR